MRQIKKNEKEKLECMSIVNLQILDAILEDNDEKFIELVTQNSTDDNYNKRLIITKYKMPTILSNKPTYSSVCAAFGSEKCFNSILSLFPDGIKSIPINEADDQGREPIHFACFSGNLNILRLYYQEEYDFNKKDSQGRSLCHYAAMSSSIDAMKYLWTKGIKVLNQKDNKYLTPMDIACLYGNFEIVKFLYEIVANKNNKVFSSNAVYHSRDYEKETPLHLACQSGCIEIVNFILSKKQLAANLIKSLDSKKRTPLHCAIQNGNLACVKSLVKIGNAQITGKNRRHIAIIDAAAGGYEDIVIFLLQQKNIDIKVINSKGINALQAAIFNDHLNIVKILIENGAVDDCNDDKIADLFLKTCALKDIEMIKYFDGKFNIPYEKKGDKFMKQAIIIEWKELVCFLLDKKCTFNEIHNYISFKSKWTPFMSFLKEKGADFLSNPEDDYTCPLIIKSIKSGNLKTVKKMIEEGAELTKEMIYKYNCFLYGCRMLKMDLFNFLLSYEPDIEYPGSIILELIETYGFLKQKNQVSQQKIDDCITMAKILIDRYKIDLNNYKIISKIVYSCSNEFLEILADNSTDFNIYPLNYSLMTRSVFLPVFIFLENHGCKFELTTTDSYVYRWHSFQYINEERNKDKWSKYSPVYLNIRMSDSIDYDVNTLLFLIKYAKSDDLKNTIYYNGTSNKNVIDVLAFFRCYDGILKVFLKLNDVLYPEQYAKDDFLKFINRSYNQNLIVFTRCHI